MFFSLLLNNPLNNKTVQGQNLHSPLKGYHHFHWLSVMPPGRFDTQVQHFPMDYKPISLYLFFIIAIPHWTFAITLIPNAFSKQGRAFSNSPLSQRHCPMRLFVKTKVRRSFNSSPILYCFLIVIQCLRIILINILIIDT